MSTFLSMSDTISNSGSVCTFCNWIHFTTWGCRVGVRIRQPLHRTEQFTVLPGAVSVHCGSVCFHDFPSIPGRTVGCLSGLRVRSWQWQLERYGLYTALMCIIGHVTLNALFSFSVSGVTQIKLWFPVGGWQTWPSVNKPGLTLHGNSVKVLATYKCLYSRHAWVQPMF